MSCPEFPQCPPSCLDSLCRLLLKEGPREEALDRLAGLAVRLLNASGALIYLTDGARRVVKGRAGSGESAGAPLTVPIRTSGGELLGTLEVLDEGARRWTEADHDDAAGVAELVATELQLRAEIAGRRRSERDLRDVLTRARCLVWHAEITQDEQGGLIWAMHPVDADAAAWLLPPSHDGSFSVAWECARLPEDRERAVSHARASVLRGEDYSVDFRCRDREGRLRWIREEVRVDPDGPGRWRAVGVCTDVSDQRFAEHALRESEQLFRGLVQHTSDVLTILAPDGTIRYESPSVSRVLGYDQDELIGTNVFDRIHPDDAPAVREVVARYLRDPETRESCELRFRHADGSWRWFESIAMNRVDDPQIRGLVANCRDITERKRTEAWQRAVLESADELMRAPDESTLYRRAVELARDRLGIERCGIFILDDAGDWARGTWGIDMRGRLVSLDGCRIPTTGETRAVLYGGSGGAPPWSAETVATLRSYEGGCTQEVGHGWVARTPIRSSSAPIGLMFNDTAISGAALDAAQQETLAMFCALLGTISERLRAEVSLREQHALIQAVVEGTSDAVFVKDLEGRYLMINSAGAAMLGASVEEVVGRTDEAFFPPDEVRLIRDTDGRVRRSGERTTYITQDSRDGKQRTLMAIKAPFRSVTGEVLGVVGIVRDITEVRQLEHQLRQAQKMDAIGQLAGGIAHDFNNMLAVITGYTNLLLDRLPADDPTRAPILEIHRAGERASGLTRQLLAFSRRQILEPRVLDLNELVRTTAGMLDRLIGEDIELMTQSGPELGRVKADPGQIEQVLVNLVVNARDAMPHGGRLTIATRNVDLEGPFVREHPEVLPGRYVALAVRDTGTGMAPDVAARAFEPFFTTKDVGKGTGLGLATVYGIIKQSGGYIYLKTAPGKGSEFTVYLPRIDRECRQDAPVTAPALPDGTETLLVVEDEEMLRRLAVRVLEGCGYTVLQARNRIDALRVAGEHEGPIHLLLTDVVMPGGGGSTLAKELQENRPETRVLYMSGYTEDAIVRHGLARAEVSFLPKPFSPLELARKVRSVLDSY
ncbi:MAG: PAS domain S-box protein [Armatimonadota bacterium]